MSDLIERQAAIDAIDEISREVDDGDGFDYAKWRQYFCELPPEERDTAEWIESKGQKILLEDLFKKGEVWRVCSKCGAGFMIGSKYECDKVYHETFHNFCPKCGRRMVLVQ
jgi:hypothetical protein